MDKSEIANRFTEVVARVIDIRDQEHEGRYPPYDHEGWIKRYNGIPLEELPKAMVEFNTFKPVVDMIVSQLLMALDDEEWERGKRPAFTN